MVRIIVVFQRCSLQLHILNLQLDVLDWDVLIGAVSKEHHWTLVISSV